MHITGIIRHNATRQIPACSGSSLRFPGFGVPCSVFGVMPTHATSFHILSIVENTA
jgi:hypothetical protein